MPVTSCDVMRLVMDKTYKTDVACVKLCEVGSPEVVRLHTCCFFVKICCVKLLMPNCNIPSSRYDAAVSVYVCLCLCVCLCVSVSLLDAVGDMM